MGGHVAATVRDAGHEVRVLDALLPTVHPTYSRRPPRQDGMGLLVGDVPDRDVVNRALSGQPLCWQDVVKTFEEALGREVPTRSVPLGTSVLPGLPDAVSGVLTALDTYDSPWT